MDTRKIRDTLFGVSRSAEHSRVGATSGSIGDSAMESSVSRQVNAIINDTAKPANEGEARPYGESGKNPRTKGGIRSLGDITLKAETVKAELAALFAKEPDLADDQYLRQCMVEGETNAYEFMQDLLTTVTELEILIEGIEQTQNAMAARKARFRRRVESIKALSLGVLKGSDLPRLDLPTATFFVRGGLESVQVEDIDLLPDQYVTKEPKREEIKDALKAGTTVAGCALTTGPDFLVIRNR